MRLDGFLRNYIKRSKEMIKSYKHYEECMKKRFEDSENLKTTKKGKKSKFGFFLNVDFQYSFIFNDGDEDIHMVEVSPGIWEPQ
jgi:hypothetical protein